MLEFFFIVSSITNIRWPLTIGKYHQLTWQMVITIHNTIVNEPSTSPRTKHAFLFVREEEPLEIQDFHQSIELNKNESSDRGGEPVRRAFHVEEYKMDDSTVEKSCSLSTKWTRSAFPDDSLNYFELRSFVSVSLARDAYLTSLNREWAFSRKSMQTVKDWSTILSTAQLRPIM